MSLDLNRAVRSEVMQMIDRSGLYHNSIDDQWEIWEVDGDGNKTLIGVCDYSVGEEECQEWWNEYTQLKWAFEKGVIKEVSPITVDQPNPDQVDENGEPTDEAVANSIKVHNVH